MPADTTHTGKQSPWRNGDTITVEELLNDRLMLGIPHFQRGLVWNTSSISALLESLFYDTPCGSFVFWQPSSPNEHGIPLDGGVPESPISFLVVDGQQRIRSVRAVYDSVTLVDEEGDDDNGEDAPSGEGRDRLWCVNLTLAPSFEGLFSKERRDRPLFVYAVDPVAPGERSAFRLNLLPLTKVETWHDWDEIDKGYRDLIRPDDPKGIGLDEKLREAYLEPHGLVLMPHMRLRLAPVQAKWWVGDEVVYF